MSSTEEFIQELKGSLGPYIKTREEAAFVRRIIALHLESTLPETTIAPPLALVDPPAVPHPGPELRGRQREYLVALAANLKARRNFDALRQKANAPRLRPETSPEQRPDLLSHHLAIAKLSRKLSRLQILQKHLDQLSSLPAASHNFLSPDTVADDTATPLPTVPKSVISGVGLASAQRDVVRSDLNDLLNDLEKSVLRAKLSLRREEEALADAKATSSVANGSSTVDSAARLQALTTTRNELIAWIENELSKAGDGMEDDELDNGEDKAPLPTRTPGGRLHKGVAKVHERRNMEIKLREIREKYAQYIESRKELVLMLQKPSAISSASSSKDGTVNIFANKPDLHPPKNRSHQAHSHTAGNSSSTQVTKPVLMPPPPQAHLLTPYLSALLRLSREQKALIQQKSHINVHLSHAARDTASAMDRMAEESQLLPRFPVPKQLQKLAALDGLGGVAVARSPGAETLQKVKGWRHAAGEAKISTLENVTEMVEEGQLALESANRALDEADELLGMERGKVEGGVETEEASTVDVTEDDIWLKQEKGSCSGKGGKKTAAGSLAERRRGKQQQPPASANVRTKMEKHDIWECLDGDLGGLNSP